MALTKSLAQVLAAMPLLAAAFFGYHQVDWTQKHPLAVACARLILGVASLWLVLSIGQVALEALMSDSRTTRDPESSQPSIPARGASTDVGGAPTGQAVFTPAPAGTTVLRLGRVERALTYQLAPPGCPDSELRLDVKSFLTTRNLEMSIVIDDVTPAGVRLEARTDGKPPAYVDTHGSITLQVPLESGNGEVDLRSTGSLGADCRRRVIFGIQRIVVN